MGLEYQMKNLSSYFVSSGWDIKIFKFRDTGQNRIFWGLLWKQSGEWSRGTEIRGKQTCEGDAGMRHRRPFSGGCMVLGTKAQNQKGLGAHPSPHGPISVCAAFMRKDLLSVKKSVNLYPSFAVFWNDILCLDEFPGFRVPVIFALGPRIHWRIQNQHKDRNYKQGYLHWMVCISLQIQGRVLL